MANSNAQKKTSGDQALLEAEERAAKAEKELAETRKMVDELRSERDTDSRRRSASRADDRNQRADPEDAADPIEALRAEPMMAHLLDALEQGQDIGHYGRLVFAMVAHHFLPPEEVAAWLTRDRDFSEEAALAMLRQVEGRDYNPPKRERILAWQSEQEFPIIPNPDDLDCGNVYRNLRFPQQVYDDIQNYQEKKAE